VLFKDAGQRITVEKAFMADGKRIGGGRGLSQLPE
jgi:hypothetical protein